MINQSLILFLQKGLVYLTIFFLSPGFLRAQQSEQKIETRQIDLIRFAKQKNANWVMEKRIADSLTDVLAIPITYIENDSRVIILQRLGYNNKPVYYATDNIDAASIISVDQLWINGNDYPALTGEAVEINVWDGGAILSTHQELQNGPGTRVVMRDTDLPVSNHSTHIAGTMIATGIDTDARGMAGKAAIKGWDLNDDIAEMASSAADGIILSNHSYGPLCGWYYNTTNENWYWYGDPDISPVEDYEFGFYDQVSADLDYIAWNAPDYLIVKSAGNDRNDTPASSFVHYVWDGIWTLVNVEREPDGGKDGFDCLNPMAVAKNILTVGAVDDAKAMTSFSAFGPTDDGRIKPDVVANGYAVYSSIAASINRYEVYNGTSMSAASASGSVALLHQLQKILQPGVTLKSSTIKAILIHTATEAGNSTGPDYSFGWGLLNIKEAADLISQNSENGGENIYEGTISQGEIISIPVETSSGPFLKVTLCWTDPSGLPSSPSLNPRTVKLVNDLDVKVENSVSFQSYQPWVLDVENPSMAAARGTNHTDNVEQVYIVNPGENNFNVKISHSGSLTGGSQSFSLIVSGSATPIGIFPPQNLSYSINESDILLNWNPPADGIPVSYKIYRNGEVLDGTRETSYNDESLILNNLYEYYITAIYDLNTEQIESVGTNRVTVFPQTSRPLPFHVDFEIAPTEVKIKNSEAGWQWGDSESLNCYYLDFSDNTTKFIGIDSYSAGEAVHVSDVATTIPLRLSDYDNIVLSFDYLLKTGIYDAIDELHVVYKLQEETQWHDLKNLESSFDWKYISIELPEEMCKNGTQIGFYYDDFYQWGMGAGLDNIEIVGTPVRSFDLSLNSMVSPLPACSLSADEDVIVTVRNAGTQAALQGDIINLRMDLSTGVSVTDNIVLTENLNSGEIISHQMSVGVDLSATGNYIFDFTLSSALDQNTANDHLESSVEVFGFPTAQILNSDVEFCEDEPQVLVQVSPSGGNLSGPGISGLYFNPAVAGAGSHTITYSYTDQNGCDATATRLFAVNALPKPAILNSDITFCIDEPVVIVQASPAGGILSGPGISGLNFNPTVAGAGSHNITYSYTDQYGCDATVTRLFTVNALPQPAILNSDVTFCVDELPVPVEVSPTGGILSGPGISGLNFNPTVAGAGSHTITYSYTDQYGCDATVTRLFTVNALPQPAILNSDVTFCLDELPVPVEVSPPGGILSGPGISGQNFNPAVAGVGSHTIAYSYTDQYGCDATVTRLFTVNALPQPAILNSDVTFCVDEPLMPVAVSPTGGILSGPGISGLNFNPAVAGVGSHTIAYSYTDQYGCDATVTRLFTVNALPQPAILNSDVTFCLDELPVPVEVSPPGGILSGPGISGQNFNPAAAGVGSHTIAYSYTDPSGCTGLVVKQVLIIENPLVNLGPDQIISLNETIQLVPSGNGFSFLWYDGSRDNKLIITAETLGVGIYYIWVIATSIDYCSSADSLKLTINVLNHADSNNTILDPSIYPNPFRKDFYMKIDENETLENTILYGLDGGLYLTGIPETFPYFNVSYLPSGFYILKIQTNRRIYLLQIIKI